MYIVIERFGNIEILRDDTCEVMKFDYLDEAAEAARQYCQDGKVVNLDIP